MRSLSLKSLARVAAVLGAMSIGTACSKDTTGGTSATGGTQNGGGSSDSGGAGGAGGGSANGGSAGSGGVTGAGGSPGSGGVAGGGRAGSGGVAGVGGTAPAGGTTAAGGATSAGGTTARGGATSSGGATARGGAGGVTSSGGATVRGGAGGTTGSGGATGTNPPPATDFTDTVNGVAIDMVYVPGGTFTIGCESASCPADTKPVSGVTVSSYHIGKIEVTTGMWNAVMGTTSSGPGGTSNSMTSITWYEAMEFACKLSQTTGRSYRMPTEAEWEYAAKNHLSSLGKVGTGEEWAYNSWNTAHMGGTDPVGPNSGKHTQKTRRDAQGTVDNITGRLIRSIDGVGPALRLAISAETAFPPDYVPPCDLKAPVMGEEPVNSYRDLRWVTGSDAQWTTGSIAIGKFDLRVWDDGTARYNNKDGQWFTSNNIAFVFVPSSGSSVKLAYIFLDETQASLISDTSFMSGGFVGRIEKKSATNLAKPTLSGLKSGAELAAAAGDDYKMVDMVNIPESAKKQDPRLLDGTDQGWFQDNTSAGGLHHYRKDVDPDEFRFTVNQGQMVMLANGAWFTVNNTFLRITHSTGYTTDYLYAITSDGYFLHDSYQAYERADFRMFKKKANSETFPASCGSHCSSEIPKGEPASMYARMDNGHSTFVPAPCPADGCK